LDQQAELVAGCFSRDPENTRATGQSLYLDPARCYRSYQEMAEQEVKLPADRRIDFVSIVTPNVSHFAIARTFLKAGIHVVCDKPMTFTLDEARDLVKIVEQSGLVFALTHNYTGYPLIRHARHLFQSGEKLGSKQAAWRVDPAQSGIGGTLGDVGTHCVNLLEYVTGDPISQICADKSTFLPDRTLDEDVNALLRFKGGGKGVLTISQVSCGEENGLILRVYGTQGAIKWAQENPNYMEFYRYGEPRQTLTRSAGYLSAAAAEVTRIPAGHPEGFLEAFATVYGGAIQAIRRYIDGKPIPAAEYKFPTVYDGRRGMQFIYAAYESATKGSVWVDL
jgi:predicted dehydrogenase